MRAKQTTPKGRPAKAGVYWSVPSTRIVVIISRKSSVVDGSLGAGGLFAVLLGRVGGRPATATTVALSAPVPGLAVFGDCGGGTRLRTIVLPILGWLV